jgi:porin
VSVAVLVLTLLAGPTALQAGDAPERSAGSQLLASWLESDYMTGTWGGLRTKLADLGIVPSLFSTIDVQGNPMGGAHQTVRYFQYTGLELAVDLDTLWGWPGSSMQVSGYWGSGGSLSQEIRNVFTVAETCCVGSIRLVDLWVEQSWAEALVNIRLGRVAAGDEFMTLPVFLSFVQGSINANPSAIFFNVPFSAYPLTTWGPDFASRPPSGSI